MPKSPCWPIPASRCASGFALAASGPSASFLIEATRPSRSCAPCALTSGQRICSSSCPFCCRTPLPPQPSWFALACLLLLFASLPRPPTSSTTCSISRPIASTRKSASGPSRREIYLPLPASARPAALLLLALGGARLLPFSFLRLAAPLPGHDACLLRPISSGFRLWMCWSFPGCTHFGCSQAAPRPARTSPIGLPASLCSSSFSSHRQAVRRVGESERQRLRCPGMAAATC